VGREFIGQFQQLHAGFVGSVVQLILVRRIAPAVVIRFFGWTASLSGRVFLKSRIVLALAGSTCLATTGR
jgi:hypothetical protein